MIKKLDLTINQLIGSDLFLGYHLSNWNPRINYFLLGKYRNTNVFNLNYTYSFSKKFISLVTSLSLKKSKMWLVNENFELFQRSTVLTNLQKHFPEIIFVNSKWCKGTLSNYKHVRVVKTFSFPHALFLPNMENNHYVINEGFIINIPTWALADSIDNPSNVFFPIPGNSKSIKSLFFFYLLTAKSVLSSRYFSSSSFILKAYLSGKKFFLKNFGLNNNLTSIFLKNYFTIFRKKFLLETVLFIFKKKSVKIKKLFRFFFLTLKDRRKRRRKLKLRQAGWQRTVLLSWKISFLLLVGFFRNILSLSLFHIFRLPSVLSVKVRPFFKGLLLLSIL
jgi:ribosomal protein S2